MPLLIRSIVTVAGDTRLPATAINLFTVTALSALRADPTGQQCEITVTLRELAKVLGAGIATLSRSYSQLERAGYIRRAAQERVGDPTRITILPPSPPVAG